MFQFSVEACSQLRTSKLFVILSATILFTISADRAAADTFGSGANSFDIEFVTVGDPGNPPADTTDNPNGGYPTGSVSSIYRIGKFEVSRDMVNKANTEGALGITLENMDDWGISGANGPDKPATGVTWVEATRFVNWLNTSIGSSPAYNFDGNGNFQIWTPSDSGYDPNNRFRNSLAKYFLPSVHEWHKAAYYDPTTESYFNFPTGSDTEPTPVASGTAAGTAMYGQTIRFGPADITLAGGLSRYGTMGQGGNVWEWEESETDMVNDASLRARGVRGGSWFLYSGYMLSESRGSESPLNEHNDVGFRVASSIPEPSTLLLGAMAGLGLMLWRSRGLVCASILVVAVGISCADCADAVTIDMVTVGNPGNAADTRYNSISVGLVANAYRIGKYEVTAGQYTEFLNAVAKADSNGLYNTAMGLPFSTFGANIQRTGSSPNYSYNVAADWANRPVNFVSFWDAARFANWLDNGQPTGAQGPGTTEGGAYHDVGNQALFGRNAGARFFVPTEDEWYKAAYHDKAAGLAASFFDYSTGSNATPGFDITETTNPGNNANYTIDNIFALGPPYMRTIAGEFELSDSPYGTFDQGGNVWEWNETVVESSGRGLRGASFYYGDSSELHASVRGVSDPTGERSDVGFRVASIPELPGDFNHDGTVNAADYVVWRKTGGPPDDYNTWRTNFGRSFSTGSGSAGYPLGASAEPLSPAVPEPCSLMLAAAAGCGLITSRRRRAT